MGETNLATQEFLKSRNWNGVIILLGHGNVFKMDELEALASIYGEDWKVVDAGQRVYSIDITDGELQLSLQVTLTPGYPGDTPPIYQLSAPWLKGKERKELSALLEDIYCENIGETIIYLWVECVREFVQSRLDRSSERDKADDTASQSHESCHEDVVVTSGIAGIELATAGEVGWSVEEQGEGQVQWKAYDGKKDKEGEGPVYACPMIYHSDYLHDRKSKFQGHIAAVTSEAEVDLVMATILADKRCAAATHNILTYRILHKPAEENRVATYLTNNVDDGEKGASVQMLRLLEITDSTNVIVIVTRWYGGIHLGPDRFRHINGISRQLLEEHGYLQNKESKKGVKSSKKKHKGK